MIIGAALIFAALLLIICGGDLLPIWIFLTSLTLIVHTILFSVSLPDQIFVVLKCMLKFLRLDILPAFFPELRDYLKYEEREPPEEFLLAGYESYRYLTSVTDLVLAIFALLIVMWLLSLLKDLFCIGSCCHKSEAERQV